MAASGERVSSKNPLTETYEDDEKQLPEFDEQDYSSKLVPSQIIHITSSQL